MSEIQHDKKSAGQAEPAAASPSEQLAKRILKRLVTEELLSAEAANGLYPKLSSGQLRQEDWRLPIELAIEKGKAK